MTVRAVQRNLDYISMVVQLFRFSNKATRNVFYYLKQNSTKLFKLNVIE